jgi:hypothetical protein
MGLLLEMLDTESLDDSGNSLTTCNSNHIDLLVLSEHLIDIHGLFKEIVGVLDFLVDCATIDLDFENVILLLAEVKLIHLGMDDDTDDGAILLDAVELDLNVVGVLGDLLLVLWECLLLGVQPVLIETSKGILGKLVGPNCSKSAESSRGFNVPNDTDYDYGWGFNDGYSLEGLFLVELGTGTVDVTQNVCHTGLETSKSGQMDGLELVVAREWSYSSSVVSCAAPGNES